ncbi:hypothetical protein [Catellatospora sp. NPDC049609]|uniref:hypothetical protein n=1 Tax=Catellatospora sp. NPDC049609 TaxID=3155505 RepID=UPI003448E5CE
MGTPIAEREFLRYAEAQAAYGVHLLAVHRRDHTGCCRQCGRSHPCDERSHGARLIAHYADWQPEPQLVRPYLTG